MEGLKEEMKPAKVFQAVVDATSSLMVDGMDRSRDATINLQATYNPLDVTNVDFNALYDVVESTDFHIQNPSGSSYHDFVVDYRDIMIPHVI
ncbi:hypothetical protein V6N13_116031 [Hibiscus sabdariffa]